MNPLLVLLPGLDGTGRLFDPLLQVLPEDWPARVVAYPPDRPLGYRELLPLVLAALPGDGRAYVLLGESFGGPLALKAALAAPRPPVAVVLSASFIRNPSWAWPRLVECFGPFARLLPDAWRIRGLLGRAQDAAVERTLVDIQGQVAMPVFHARLLEVMRVEAGPELAQCPCPVLYLRGREDRVVPRRALLSARSVRSDLEVATFPTGHLLLQLAPRPAFEAIRAFLEKHGLVAP